MNKRDYELEDLTKEEIKELEKNFPDLKHEKEMRQQVSKLFDEDEHERIVEEFLAKKGKEKLIDEL